MTADNQPVIKLTIDQSDDVLFGRPVTQKGIVSAFFPVEVWTGDGRVRYFTVSEVIEKLLGED